MQAEEILAYLDDNPDFLASHAPRYGLKPLQDRVVSFADRQMLDLKDRNRQLEARLTQLIRHGEQNDQIVARSHKLAVSLLRGQSLAEVHQAIQHSFAEHFGLPRVALRLWHPGAESSELYNSRQDIRLLAGNLSAPYCGPYANDEIISWFPTTPVLQSFAQLALRDGTEPFGMLVIASDDAQRFTLEMQTHYLAQMAELMSQALLRVLGKA
ncbi:DUF484 family protein [Vogesella facilis]|uniref:DUF484 family protein n=1 Tax=Vogesella facilis TaxID=1655232 RepID=A0ABV7RDL9_9NEIS